MADDDTRNGKRPRRFPADAALTLALALCAMVATGAGMEPHGIGFSQDSWGYRDAAINLAKMEGMASGQGEHLRIITRWPPLYSLLLAPSVHFGADVSRWAAAVHLALLGALVALVYWLARNTAGRTSALCATLLVVVGNTLLVQFGMLLSEALFLTLQVALLGALVYCHQRPTLWAAAGAGALAALVTLTRLAGEGLILGGVACLFLMPGATWRKRLALSGMFVIAAQLPVALFLARNVMLTDAVSDLGFSPRAPQAEPFLDLWRVATIFWIPESWPRWPRHLAMLALVAVSALAHVGKEISAMEGVRALRRSCLWFMACYALFLLWTFFTSRAQPHLDLRMMLPVMIPLALLVGAALKTQDTALKRLLMLMCALLFALGCARAADQIGAMRAQGPYSAWLYHGWAP